jgi:hypothetical protein
MAALGRSLSMLLWMRRQECRQLASDWTNMVAVGHRFCK